MLLLCSLTDLTVVTVMIFNVIVNVIYRGILCMLYHLQSLLVPHEKVNVIIHFLGSAISENSESWKQTSKGNSTFFNLVLGRALGA